MMRRDKERGAALLIVLLLVATLSFIALAIGERTVLSSSRSGNARARSEILWIATGLDALARAAIEQSLEGGTGLTPESALFAAPVDIPFDNGGAVISFADRTRCFNLNAFGGDAAGEETLSEFRALTEAIDSAPAGAAALGPAIKDWIDADSLPEPGGAEDSEYAGLPAPYRTGGTLLADVSEVRAVSGGDVAVYAALRPYMCALPVTDPMVVNVNMLEPRDAPVIAAMTGGAVSASEIADVIAQRPAGGYAAGGDFWASPVFTNAALPEGVLSRAGVTSRFIEAYAVITVGGVTMNASMLFEAGSGGPRLIRRRFERFN